MSPIVETYQLFVWVPHRMAACAEKSSVLPQNQPPPTFKVIGCLSGPLIHLWQADRGKDYGSQSCQKN